MNITLTWVCVNSFGVAGAGMGFFGSYLFHFLLIYPIVRRLSGFSWSLQNMKVAGIFLGLLICVYFGSFLLSPSSMMAFGSLVLLLSGAYSIRTLVELVPWARIPHRLRVGLEWLRMGPRSSVSSDE